MSAPVGRVAVVEEKPRHHASGGNGVFIVFEGLDGSGKSTQAGILAEQLRTSGHHVVLTREPGDSRIGPEVRRIVLHGGDLDPRAEALLFAADRADHVASVIRPALADGSVVLCDRYVDSSVAYQGVGRGLGVDAVAALSEFAVAGLHPHLTIILDIPVDEVRRRVDHLRAADRIEREPDSVHHAIRQAFLDRAARHPDRYVVIDGSAEATVVATRVADAVKAVLP